MTELLTVKEAAKELKLAERTIWKYLQEGTLEGVAVGAKEGSGRRWRVPRESVDRFIRERLSGNRSANKAKEGI